jgi:endoglycosylceramidase
MIFVCILFLIFNLISSWPFRHQNSKIRFVESEDGQIYDELGRSRLFHGVNIVYKTFPYVPDLDSFDPRFSFSQKDVDLLADLGMNVIRLDVSWAGAEPIRGSYNQSYFNQLHRIIDMCAKKGIYVILEWHQDLFSEKYCGNGAPLWASRPLTKRKKF